MHPYQNNDGGWEWIINPIPHFIKDVIIHPSWVVPVIFVAAVPHNDGVSQLRQYDGDTIMFHNLIGLCNSIAPVLAGWLY